MMIKVSGGREGKSSVRAVLPAELAQFLNRRSYSLLIKGEAATGKTILALSILKEFGAGGNYLYLSTRVSPSQLFENHPWLADLPRPRSGRSATNRKTRIRADSWTLGSTNRSHSSSGLQTS